jgi:hypothetical protein
MYVYVCMYVCMYVCVYIYRYIYSYFVTVSKLDGTYVDSARRRLGLQISLSEHVSNRENKVR